MLKTFVNAKIIKTFDPFEIKEFLKLQQLLSVHSNTEESVGNHRGNEIVRLWSGKLDSEQHKKLLVGPQRRD